MSTIGEGGIQGVLAQIRALRAETAGSASAPSAAPAGGASFTSAMTQALDRVSDYQKQSATNAEAFERGDRNVSLAQVMLSMQQSQVAFKAVVEVRNRLVQAYQDIQNMPI